MVAQTDAFTVRHLSGVNRTVIASGINNALTLDDASGFEEGDQVAVSDCGGTDIFEIDTVDIGTGEVKPLANLSREYDTNGDPDDAGNPMVSAVVAIRYFVGNGADGPGLFREVIRGGVVQPIQELISGVEEMHIVYGVDNNGDKVPDTYLKAGAAGLQSDTEWQSVIAVRIAMLVRTLEEYGQDIDNQTYTLNDRVVGPLGDRFKRRVFSTTVLLRNRLI